MNVRRVEIKSLAVYVPPRVLTNADLEKMVETTDEWIMQRTGIRERHIVDPGVATSDLATMAAREAIQKAGLTPDDIDHVNAHATSTPEGDKAELNAIRTIFGEDAGRVSVTANKSMVGHTLGAAGAIEAIATIMAIREGCVPPTINLQNPDPLAEGLDLTPDVATRREIRAALSNSFGFGGQNTALVFTRWDG